MGANPKTRRCRYPTAGQELNAGTTMGRNVITTGKNQALVELKTIVGKSTTLPSYGSQKPSDKRSRSPAGRIQSSSGAHERWEWTS